MVKRKTRKNKARGRKGDRTTRSKVEQYRTTQPAFKRLSKSPKKTDPYAYLKPMRTFSPGPIGPHRRRKTWKKRTGRYYRRYAKEATKLLPEEEDDPELEARRALLTGFFLVFVLSARVMDRVTTNLEKFNVEKAEKLKVDKVLVVSCSANTCRSAMVAHEASKKGFKLTTCGTSQDNTWGNPMTQAAQARMSGDELAVAKTHHSQACNVCEGFQGNKVFAVMAESNKQDLENQAKACGVKSPEIVVLGDVPELPGCIPLKVDPWYNSTAALCSEGNCTAAQKKEEAIAYSQLAFNSKKCVGDIIAWSKKGGPQLRLSKPQLTAIAEGIQKSLSKKKPTKKKRRRKKSSKRQ